MTRCNKSKPKLRHSNKKSGNPSDYKHGMKGHTWKRFSKEILLDNDSLVTVCVGRKCDCGKVHYNPTGKKYLNKQVNI